MFKSESQDINKEKKCHKVKVLDQETWKHYCRIKNSQKLCLLEIIEQVHGNDKVTWDLGDLLYEKKNLSV